MSESQGEDRLLGAVIPRGKQTWFFKLTGPDRLVAEPQQIGFAQFVKSIRFSERGPEWSLPEGWKEEAGSGMRYATVRVPTAEKPLELTVIPLPTGDGDLEGYVLANVNRWRNQMQVAPLEKKDLDTSSLKFDLDDTQVWVVNILGHASQQSMGALPPRGADSPAAERGTSPGFTSAVPEGWTKGVPRQFQLASYEVRDGSKQANISVSQAGGDLNANINRWRGQVQLPPLDEAGIKQQMQKVTIGGHEGMLVELAGPDRASGQAILGAVVNVGGEQWFFKLMGDAELAAREKSHFEEFLKSVKFGE